MVNSKIPWGRDPVENTGNLSAIENWAYWQNRINRASLVMLKEQKIISEEQAYRIAKAQLEAEKRQRQPDFPPIYDIMPLEKLLIENCGQEATLIHTGRSRQDIFATLLQARLRRAFLDTFSCLNDLREQLLNLAEAHTKTWMPAYTNGVQAMPITLGFYLWGFLESFERDSQRFHEAWKRINRCALGTGVLACSAWPLSRERLSELLGFDGPIVNGLDSSQISLFDIPLEAASIVSNIAIRISVLIQDFAQQYSQTRPWILLDDSDAYGSSAMPQKRNPGILNKARARASDVVGAVSTAYIRDHNINLGMYDNKESVNEDNSKVFALACSMLQITRDAFSMLKINKERALEELENDWTCTMALAEALQMKYNVPFRVGHNFASDVVTKGRKHGWIPKTFPFDEAKASYQAVTEKLEGTTQSLPMSEEEFRQFLSPQYVVMTRIGTGAPNPRSTKKNLKIIRKKLIEDQQWVAGTNNKLFGAQVMLDKEFEKLLQRENQGD